uniref:Uncharacterized protein n=1 Tax=Fagus sylvatica TaxID=28930 RepID=A0A2N9EDJ6_FAGSY
MVGETNGPNEHEVRMATSEHKFDDLLAFVYMMVKQVVETGNQKRKDDKNTNGEVSEGRPHINMDPLPRPPTLPKPKERDPQLDSKIDDSEEKIRLMRGLSSFGTQIPSNRGCGAVKTKRMVDMPALMALVEQIAKRTLVEKNEGGVQDDSQERQGNGRRLFHVILHLESAKVGSDSTNSQGAQDLNDLLGLLRGVMFERSQQEEPAAATSR